MIKHPEFTHIQGLRQLWKDTFGDSDAFLDIFFQTAFSTKRCLCVTMDETVVAALYWFDCGFGNEKIAYIYAVATAKAFRGQGICHALMEQTHLLLKEKGYAGAILSPAEDSLFHFYKKIGYETCAYVKETHYHNSINSHPAPTPEMKIRQISKTEFAKLRRDFLPKTGLIQEDENLDFLEQQATFYAGENFLLTAQTNDISTQKHIIGVEFLGDASVIPAIVAFFACTSGTFRMPGKEKPLAMYYAFTTSISKPDYLGFIFD